MRGPGKQAKNAEDQRLALKIVHFGIARRGIDALRKLGDNSFLLVEGAGTLDRVVIKDNGFAVTPICGNFSTPTSVALIGTTAWVTEGNTTYFFDISKKNVTPPLPFRIYAVSLRKENTK